MGKLTLQNKIVQKQSYSEQVFFTAEMWEFKTWFQWFPFCLKLFSEKIK